ncbi:unnamed protein product [Ilex paraguariensis]|uniref:Uncharacterized protein n=1 Tax=Ilex paraguariensis TaxID=185542 RepID=A0ABC8UQX1_9AQUA
MEQDESQTLPGDWKKKGKNVVWSKEMDRCLILELVLQANEGYKVDKGFKDHAYTVALSAMNQVLTFLSVETIVLIGKYINANLSRQMDVSVDEYTPVFYHNEKMVVDNLGDIEGNGSGHQQDNDSIQMPT